jgi:hypothetical protein
MEVLEPIAGDHVRPHRRGHAGAHAGGGPAAPPASGFATSFDLFGGAEALDDLCDLSNQCSRILNRARAALGPERTASMDVTLSALAPLFDVSRPVPGGAASSGGAPRESEGSVDDGMGPAYGPVRALVSKAQRKAEALAAELSEARAAEAAAAEAAAQRGAAAAGARVGSGGGSPEIEEEGEEEEEEEEEEGGVGGGWEKVEGREPEWAAHWRAAAERCLGEVCSGQVMLLLQDARSLSAVARWGPGRLRRGDGAARARVWWGVATFQAGARPGTALAATSPSLGLSAATSGHARLVGPAHRAPPQVRPPPGRRHGVARRRRGHRAHPAPPGGQRGSTPLPLHLRLLNPHPVIAARALAVPPPGALRPAGRALRAQKPRCPFLLPAHRPRWHPPGPRPLPSARQPQAQQMVADLEAVGAAFVGPLREAAAPATVAGGARTSGGGGAAAGETVAGRAGALAAALELEKDQATARVRDALREELFVLVLVVLHREGRLSGPPPPAAAAAEAGSDDASAGSGGSDGGGAPAAAGEAGDTAAGAAPAVAAGEPAKRAEAALAGAAPHAGPAAVGRAAPAAAAALGGAATQAQQPHAEKAD